MVGVKACKTSWFDLVNILLLSLISFISIYPFIYLLFISVSPVSEVMKGSIMLFPKVFTLESYQFVLKYSGMANAYLVTIYITLVGTLINLVMTTLGAYVLANRSVPGRNFFMTMVIITMIFNGGLIPTYLVVQGIGMIDTLWALMIPNAISTFWMIVMRNFFQSLPSSLAESARIDGCSEYRILLSIMLPLSLPVLATLALFYGVYHWNEYFQAIIYLNSSKLMPLQVLIRSMYQSASVLADFDTALPPPVETIRAATIILATAPILCIYPFLQRFFVHGIMVGAIKE